MEHVELDGANPDRKRSADKKTQLDSRASMERSPNKKARKTPAETQCKEILTRVVMPPPKRMAHNADKAGPATRIIHPDSTGPQPSSTNRLVRVGTVLKDRFLLEKEIARGGMGVVYLARDLLKERYQDRHPYIAVKVLTEQYKTHPDAFISLQREAGKAQKLAHPNICTVYDFDHDDDVVFMTMEHLEGQTLDKFIMAHANTASLKTCFDIIASMCKGLSFAHSKGIVHSDFKPGNVMVMPDGSVKILDFGIASISAQHERHTQEATLFDPSRRLGALTPAYASCEMIEGQEPDPRDDIYAISCVAYELLSGRHPFKRVQSTVARDGRLKPMPIKGLNKKQWKALQHGLAFERKARTPSIEQFMSELTANASARNPIAIIALASILLVSSVAAFQIMKKAPFQQQVVQSRTLTQDEQEKINRLAEAAQVHFMVGRITDPPGSNALAAYQQILEIDPGNAQARAGIRKIADHYEKLARESWENGHLSQCRALIEDGLAVEPGHKGLIKLLNKIEPQPAWWRVAQWLRNLSAR
jgi:serine/threonine protein kinase